MKRAGIVLSFMLAGAAAGVFSASVLADTPTTTTTDTTATTSTTTEAVTVPSGVVLGNVAIGGLAVDAAEQAVLGRFSRPVVLKVGKTRVTVTPDALGVAVPADTAVAKALTVAPDTLLGLRAIVAPHEVAGFVSRLAARLDRQPVAARLVLRNFRPLVTKSVVGRTIDVRRTVRLLRTELVTGSRVPIVVPATTRQPVTTYTSIGPVIVIRRASNVLTLYNGMRYVRQFRVATGQASYPTPLGRFQIVVMWKDPWWYPPPDPWARGEKPTPPGPGNPLGTRWMGLSAPGVGIHGTPEPGSIGYSLSHGCIRMLIPQAEWLFDHVTVGTTVFIVPT